MADVPTKTEVKPEIKIDAAEDSTKLGDIEEFEDDADLVIPPKDSLDRAWLVKVPKSMWMAWNEVYQQVDDDMPVEIGRMRVYKAKNGEDQDPRNQKIQIHLHSGVDQHRELPKTYDLTLNTNGYNNTVVFSEKDLPGHRNTTFGNNRFGKPSGIRSKYERYGQRKPGGYRTAIPKSTALAPPIQHEATAHPVQDAISDAYWEKQYKEALNPKAKTTILEGIDRNMHPGTSLSSFSTFGLSSRPGVKGNKKKQSKDKAVRMSQEALLDVLNECFNEFNYWSLRALRNRLHQPETYIKSTLEGIADLVRSGDFAMNYRLKPEYEKLRKAVVKGELAPIKSDVETDQGTGDEMGEGDGDGDEEEDDDLADFEDVKMEGAGGEGS